MRLQVVTNHFIRAWICEVSVCSQLEPTNWQHLQQMMLCRFPDACQHTMYRYVPGRYLSSACNSLSILICRCQGLSCVWPFVLIFAFCAGTHVPCYVCSTSATLHVFPLHARGSPSSMVGKVCVYLLALTLHIASFCDFTDNTMMLCRFPHACQHTMYRYVPGRYLSSACNSP